MGIKNIIARGFGAFSDIAKIPTRGYTPGAAPAPPAFVPTYPTPKRRAAVPSRIRIYIEDTDGNLVNDIEAQAATEYATGLVITSMWPKGYATANFKLRRLDVLAGFAIRESYGVVVRDGVKIIWEGRLEGIKQVISGGDEYLDCRAVGWFVVLNEHYIRKRWKDIAPFSNTIWPGSRLLSDEQNTFTSTKRDSWLIVRGGANDVNRSRGEAYLEEYTPFAEVDRVTFDYRYRTGEGFQIHLYRVDDSTTEYNTSRLVNASGANGSIDRTFTGTTEKIYFQIEIDGITNPDVYDQNDYMQLTDCVVYARYDSNHSAYGSEAYTTGELVEDILRLVNNSTTVLSTDYGDLADPGYAVDAFTADTHNRASDLIQTLVNFGDASYNTYGLSVWDREGVSDSKPRVELKQFDVSDYEYIIDLNDEQLTSFTREQDGSQLYNYVIVEYIDADGLTCTRTPDDNANLKDDSSIAQDYRREVVLKIGKADTGDADNLGRQYLNYHKGRRFSGSISIVGDIRTKAGALVPAAWVRAGDRLRIANIDKTIWLRHVSYDAETGRLVVSPEVPPNRVEMKIAALKNEAAKVQPSSNTIG
jgi:hypothetical protein